MIPFYFGRSPRSLYGVYRQAKTARPHTDGVVLCYPFGQEYMRAHRAFRQMSMRLAKTGFHTLSFDYWGTGDSSGEGGDATLAQWVDDARTAADELRDTAQVSRVAFVGLRLGASIAAMAAAHRDDVSAVVLWDPAVRGADYLTEVMADRTDSVGHSRRSVLDGGTIGVAGFPLSAEMRSELAEFDLTKVAMPARPSRRFVVCSSDRPEYQAIAGLNADAMTTSLRIVPTDGNWNEFDDYGGALIPSTQIDSIVSHLASEAA